MARYTFIDVPNTTGTLRDCLNFTLDWGRLFTFLTNKKWNCAGVYFYKGYKGEKDKTQLEEKLGKEIGYKLRIKPTHIHRDKIKDVIVNCEYCNNEFVHKYKVNGNQKSNCDVELTVDTLEVLKAGDEALIFTGDGDFSYLVETLIDKDIKVYLVSSQLPNKNGNYRFSTRLKKLLRREGEASKKLVFLDIGRWRGNIEKVQ